MKKANTLASRRTPTASNWLNNWGGPCGAHVFEVFFGLEDEPVKSVKMKVETRSADLALQGRDGGGIGADVRGVLRGGFQGWRLPHEFALCSLQFRFALRVSVMFHCVEPHPQKKVKPNKRAVSTKSTRIAMILNPPAGPLRRSSQNVQAHPEV